MKSLPIFGGDFMEGVAIVTNIEYNDIADAADMEIANSVSDYVKDTGEDNEEFSSFHKVKWTKELKVALRKIFADIKNGDWEDEDDGI